MTEYADVVVVGMGVGGETVAESLADAGMDVVGVEAISWEAKMMIRAADLLAEAGRVNTMAGRTDVMADFAPVAKRIREEATIDWDDKIAVDRFTGKGGRFVRGWGWLAGPGRVEVGSTRYEARRGVVIGTGTSPLIPPIDGLAETPYWTNRVAIQSGERPASLLVLGGGAVGVELAQAYARFGSRVAVVEALERLLPGEEPEASAVGQRAHESDGIEVHVASRPTKVRHNDERFSVTLHDGRKLTADRLLVAVGRRSELGGLGLETVELDPAAHAIDVDDRLRAGEKLWAVGDVTGHGAFTHVATYQAGIVVREIPGQPGPAADYRALPRVTFTDPEIGAVGLTQAQARAAGIAVRIGQAEVPSTDRGWIHQAGNAGMIKLVADAERGVLVGATAAGPNGGEVLSALVVAVHAEVPIDRLRHMNYAYPTFHRGIEDALRELG